jgi:hypothetical protein
MGKRSHTVMAANIIAADRELSSGRHGAMIRECFASRDILPGAKA